MNSPFEAIHEDLKARKQFCIRAGKQPYIQDGTRNTFTSSGWPEHRQDWLTFSEATEALQTGVKVWHAGGYRRADGIGFLVARDGQDGAQVLGGDLDCCRDPETGAMSQWAESYLQKVNPFYVEVSPSKCGLRFFVWGRLPGGRDKIFGNGPQDDLPQESRERILTAKPKAREKLAKGEPAFNGLELYESGRHLTLTGWKVAEFCFAKEDQTKAIEVALTPFLAGEATEKATEGVKREGRRGLPSLDILDVISTRGFIKSGGQLFGSHPTLGSTTGRNLVVDPSTGVWAYMHNGINSGGDAWLWLACECGAIAWEKAGAGALRDRAILEKTLRHAVSRGLISETGFEKDPTVRAVSLDDPPGGVGLDSDGTIKIVECDKDGKKGLKWLSDCAVCIHTETVAKDETEFTFKGVGAKDHRQVSFTLPATALADPRKFKAALINAFGARNRVGKLDFETVQKLTRNTRLMKRVEAPAWDGDIPLLPGVDLIENVEYRLSSKIPAAVYDGDLQKAKEVLQKLLQIHKFAPILVAAILGSPAIARWHKNDRFGVGMWGTTGTLKTTAALTAMGIYGIGYLDAPKLKAGKAGSTPVGAMEVFAAAGFLPQIYDDVKTVDSKDSQNYVATIHAVLEGEEKTKGKKDGGLRECREFLCTPIITGEVRPQEASTSARVLNLNWSHANGLLLTEVQSCAALLPIIGYHWLRFLAETDFVLGKDFEAFRSKKMEEFLGLKYTNPGRLATIYSLLLSVWDLLEASPLGDVFTEARESFKTALLEATATQGVAVTEETEISRFLNGLEELLASNPGLMMSEDGKKMIVGSIIGKWMPDGLFLLPTETLNELGKIKAFSQQPTIDSITQALGEKDLLVPGEGRHLKYRCRLNDGNPRGWYIKAEAFPQKSEVIPHGGNAKNDSKLPNVPTVPMFPPENVRENFSEDFQKNHDRLGHEKEKQENGGNCGNSGNIDSIDRLVDSDFDSKVSVPTSVPTEEKSGITCGLGPHPRKDEPTPAPDIKLAAISEYGMSGWVDPAKLAHALKLPLPEVVAWLEANYVAYERSGGGTGYRQKRAGEAQA